MMFENQSPSPARSGGAIKIVLSALGGLLVGALLLYMYDLHSTVTKLEANQASTVSTIKQMDQQVDQRLENQDSKMQAASNAMTQQMAASEKRMRARAAHLQREQAASAAQLRKEQGEQIEGVRKEQQAQFEGVRTDMATTKTDLEATKQKLERTIGDLGVQSGLIAHTREDLEQLKRKGDRNIYEFTLNKSKQPTRVSNIALQLKKTNPKRGKFTIDVTADDWTIEKKDRTLFEPMQFYTGRDRMLYEVVVMSVGKDRVSGYLSTPKQYKAQAEQGQ